MSLEGKVDKALEILFGMAPKVNDLHEGQKAMDARLRVNETRSAEHAVQIDNLKERVDGLHTKLNQVKDIPADKTRWSEIADFLGALPAYWHVGVAALSGALAMGALIWKHRP